MPADPVDAVVEAFRAEGMTGDPEQIRRFARAAVKACERDTVRLVIGYFTVLREEAHRQGNHDEAQMLAFYEGAFANASFRGESVMADDERRAEVEAALAELVRLKDGPRDDAYRATKDAAWDRARAALARARDAQGDDEACSRCQGTGKDPCGFGSPDPWVCMTWSA